VASLLVVAHGRRIHEVAQLSVESVQIADEHLLWIRYGGGEPQPLTDSDAVLIARFVRARKDQGTRWLFPSSYYPESAVRPASLTRLIRKLGFGITPTQMRRFSLRTEFEDFDIYELSNIHGFERPPDAWKSAVAGRVTPAQKRRLHDLGRMGRSVPDNRRSRSKASPQSFGPVKNALCGRS
jgi:hypothetical protein